MISKREFTVHEQSFDIHGKSMSFQTGKIATQADGSIMIRMEDNVMHIAAVMQKSAKPEIDFMPLMIDFRDSYSAAGKIGGGQFRKREWRPSDASILYARLTDRALRPMFPKGMINETVITVTPLAMDQEQDLGVMTIIGSSLAVMAAGIPFDGPVGAARIGYKDGQFIVNPTRAELETGMANLIVAGKKWSINMIECDAREIPADKIKEAFKIGQAEIDASCAMQAEFIAKLTISPKEITYNKPNEAVIARVSGIINSEKLQAMTGNTKVSFNDLYYTYEKEVLELAKEKMDEDTDGHFTYSKVKMAVFDVIKKFIRHRTITEGIRIDNRTPEDIRPIYCEVDLLPRVHGSALFRRGDTQILSTVTLGAPGDTETQESMEEDDVKKRYMHHYNFPPFSVNEARGMRGPGRREIGHGRLAEKALEYMIPDAETSPYVIRVVSECMGSGGSTSMGSVCGSTMSLMAAGVKLIKPVAGIAMGLMSETDEDGNIWAYKVITDLMGTEDFTGDMDFKVAGTRDGITAIQLDTKLKGISMEIIFETIDRSLVWYNQIMDVMLETIPAPREQVAQYAPKIKVIKIHPDKVRAVIGKGWDVINNIIEVCGWVKIDFEDDGTCFITHNDQAMIDKAVVMIEDIAVDLEIGVPYDGVVSRVEDYGLFIALPKKKSGMLHISKIGQKYEDSLTKHFKIGDKMKVKITAVDDKGRINLERVL